MVCDGSKYGLLHQDECLSDTQKLEKGFSLIAGVSAAPDQCLKNQVKKRDDLQIWRSVAIIGVLLFHIWPDVFKNGYLGVDMFFVLSGYLMASILDRPEKMTAAVVSDFYFRRIKRIAPVYLAVILISVFLLCTAVNSDLWENVQKDSKWAVVFLSNQQDLYEKRDYFDVENDFKFFKHCWSLAAEMQFYLVVPVLFFISTNLMGKERKFIVFVAVFILSLIYQVFVESPVVKYESMFARIWQFSAGMIAQTYKMKHGQSSWIIKVNQYFLLFVALLCEFSCTKIDRQIGSLAVVLCTSILIASADNGRNSPFRFLKNFGLLHNGLLYIGDISYTLYLVHWPVIVFYKFAHVGRLIPVFDGWLILSSVLTLTAVIYHSIELPLLSYCSTRKRLAVTLLAFYCLFLILCLTPFSQNTKSQVKQLNNHTVDGISNLMFGNHTIWTIIKSTSKKSINVLTGLPGNETPLKLPYTSGFNVSARTLSVLHSILNYSQPIVLPKTWTSKNDIEFADKILNDLCDTWDYNWVDTYSAYSTLPRGKLAVYESRNFPDGKYTVAAIGNSHSMCKGVALHMNPLFNKAVTLGIPGCPFPDEPGSADECKDGFVAMMDVIEKLKPDFIFVLTLHSSVSSIKKLHYPLNKDRGVQIYQQLFDKISAFTKLIIINKPDYRLPVQTCKEFIRLKEMGAPIDFAFSKTEIKKRQGSRLKLQQTRISAVNCTKCEYFDYQDACGPNFCDPIDTETLLPAFRDSHHVNILGARRFYPLFDKLIKQAIEKIKS